MPGRSVFHTVTCRPTSALGGGGGGTGARLDTAAALLSGGYAGVTSVCPVELRGAFACAFAVSNQDVQGDEGAASVLACATSPVGDCEAAGGGIGAGGASGATYGLGTALSRSSVSLNRIACARASSSSDGLSCPRAEGMNSSAAAPEPVAGLGAPRSSCDGLGGPPVPGAGGAEALGGSPAA